MKNAKTKTSKADKNKNSSLTPEVVDANEKMPYPHHLTMDSTAHIEISDIQNIHYSREIIEETRKAFSIQKLKEKLADDKSPFFAEGEFQINRLWHGIEALTVHNTMFVVLFLISIGEILREVSNALSRSDFVKWRRRVFPPKQERYLQQAQQLAKMGDFAKRYASMGKRRLLILENLRKSQNLTNHGDLFEKHPIPEDVENALPEIDKSGQIPFPDSTEDLDGALLQEHVDAIISHRRLQDADIPFASFDQAYLIAAYERGPLPVKQAQRIARWLQEKKTPATQRKWFDILLMNKLTIPEPHNSRKAAKDSLNYLLVNFNDYCQQCDFANADWIQQQKQIINYEVVRQAHGNLLNTAKALGIKLSNRAHKAKDKDSGK